MNKIAVFASIILTNCLLLSACNSNSRPVLEETIDFDLTDQAPEKISYEISVNGDVSNLIYSGEPIELNISLTNECSSIEVGFMLFSDGIPLHTTIDGKEAVMHIFHIDDEKTESFTASFIPYGESGKTVALQPVSILYPSFSLSEENTSFGFYHRFLTTAPIELKLEETKLFESSIYTNYENIPANKIAKEKYGIKGNSGDANYMFYQSDNDRKIFLSLDNNGTFDFISFDTTVNANVRICFFLNGQLVSFNNGYNYMELSLKKDYITKSENIKLDIDVSQYDTLYAFAAPIGDDYLKTISIGKSNSYCFLYNDYLDATETVSSGTSFEQDTGLKQEELNMNMEYIQLKFLGFNHEGRLYASAYNPYDFSTKLCELNTDGNIINMMDFFKNHQDYVEYSLLENGIAVHTTNYVNDKFTYTIFYDFDFNLLAEINQPCLSFALSNDGRKIAYIKYGYEDDPNLYLFLSELEKGNETILQVFDQNALFYISSLAFTSDDTHIAFTGNINNDSPFPDYLIGMLDIQNGEIVTSEVKDVDSEISIGEYGAFFRENRTDGSSVYFIDETMEVTVFNTENQGESLSCEISSNGNFLVTSMRNAAKTVYRIYDVGKKETVQLHSLENATASFCVDNIGNIYTQTYNTDEFQFIKLENLSGAF